MFTINLNTELRKYSKSYLSKNCTHPRSWLNIIVLDEQLKPVITNDGNNSYFDQVGNPGTASVKQYNPQRPITKNGYVYIYVSNETPNIYTYWDNLQVTHIHGHLLQEEGYYPFGLEMKAISSAAAMKPQTRYKFNAGTALEASFDVDYYETFFREYDAQIGRFTGVDALSEKTIAQSPYQFAINNPISFNDPTGLQIDYKNTRGEFTNWNPQLKFEPGWLTSFWDNYWSDPFAAAEMNKGGDYLEVDKNGDIKSAGVFAQALFSANMNADDDGNWALKMGFDKGKFGFWEPDYDNFSGEGNSVIVATHFVSWDEYFGKSGSNLWTLSFTGNAHDVVSDGKTRQQGVGQLAILDANGNLISKFNAISGDGGNGLIPNGTYRVYKPLMNQGFPDEKGLDFKMRLQSPIGQRTALLIHPTQYYWSGTENGVKQYSISPTDGCIGLVGHDNAAPFLQLMQIYFQSHSFISLTVDIMNNANVRIQLGNKTHY